MAYGGGDPASGVGVTTGPERVYLVFWGSQWGTQGVANGGYTSFSGDPDGMAPKLQAFFKGLGTTGDTWSGVMTQYCEGVPSGTESCPFGADQIPYPYGGALAGVWEDVSSSAPPAATAYQIGREAESAAAHFGNTTTASNRDAQYVVVSPTQTDPDSYQESGFCAWHDYTGDTTLDGGGGAAVPGPTLAFTNLPYIPDAGAGCGENFVNQGSAGLLDGVTIVEGHEYAETITDQYPPFGWIDAVNEETGDKCAWMSSGSGRALDITLTTGTFAVQSTWANDAGACETTHSTVGGAPVVASVSPSFGAPAGGTTVTISGASLGPSAPVVEFGSTPATSVSVDTTTQQITATSPPGSGTVDVTVETSVGTSPTSSADLFTYGAAGAPSAAVETPVAGGIYAVGQQVLATFDCAEGASGPGIATCVDGAGNASPDDLDTSTIGSHTFTVTATSKDGETGTASIAYTVAGAPTAIITKPKSGGIYLVGQTVNTAFSCADGTDGPGISLCYDSNGYPSPSGQLDTAEPGTYTYSINAASTDGQTDDTAATLSYTVKPDPTQLTVSFHRPALFVGVPLTVGVTVAGVPPGGGGPASGAVTVSIAGKQVCRIPVLTDKVSCTTTAAPLGTHAVVVAYSGNKEYGASSVQLKLAVAPRPVGFWLTTAGGSVFAAGHAPPLAGVAATSTNPVTAMATTLEDAGDWLVTREGTVTARGTAHNYGDLLHMPGGAPAVHVSNVVAIVATNDDAGYWLLGADGRVYPFGDAHFHGDLLHIPGLPPVHVSDIVGMVATPGGGGYLLLGSDGGVFAFGSVHFYGSLPGLGVKVHDIRAVLPAPGDTGYMLVGADGGTFVFGHGAPFEGSLPGRKIHVSDIVGLALTGDAKGYWMAGSNGTTYAFGDAPPLAQPTGVSSHLPVVAIAGA
jgi:serine protease